MSLNVLLVTLDQFRGDSWSGAGHPLVRTPHLDALAAAGSRLARHYSQAAPCAPGRASLYTGMYQMNHRVVANGTPLDAWFDTIALAGRRAGYAPAVFGYTDQALDPRLAEGPEDLRLSTYNGVLPGFDAVLDLPDDQAPWVAWLERLGYDTSPGVGRLLASESDRPAEHSLAAFLTDHALDWLARQDGPWFAHLSYFRPHPPYSAAGHWSNAYDPADVALPVAPAGGPHHPFHAHLLGEPRVTAPADEHRVRRMRAQYYGMISEVDDQLGRLWAALRDMGAWNETLVIVTSDHADMLGDHGLRGKVGYWEQSYHILGIVRHPHLATTHGAVVDAFTENVDVMPTVCEALGVAVPAQCDGLPLTPFLRGEQPPHWRDAAHWEFDWRGELIDTIGHAWPWDRALEECHLAVRRDDETAYVQFGDGSWLCFDLATDPSWRTTIEDPAIVLPRAQAMLTWRARHTDRLLADMLNERGGIGRWPPMPATWGA